MVQIIWTEPALSDLDEIAEYIALDKVEAARRLLKKYLHVLVSLNNFQNKGASLQNWSTRPIGNSSLTLAEFFIGLIRTKTYTSFMSCEVSGSFVIICWMNVLKIPANLGFM